VSVLLHKFILFDDYDDDDDDETLILTWLIVVRQQGHVTVIEESPSSQCRVYGPSQNSCKTEQKAQSSVYSDGDARTDSGSLFQTNVAAAGKVRSPMVVRRVRGATGADVLGERSRRSALR